MQRIKDLKKIAEFFRHMASEARERYAAFPLEELTSGERAEGVVTQAKAVLKAVKELDVPPRSLFEEPPVRAEDVNAAGTQVNLVAQAVIDQWTELGKIALSARRHPGRLRLKDPPDQQYAQVEAHFLQLRHVGSILHGMFPEPSTSGKLIKVSVPVKVNGKPSREHVWADRIDEITAKIHNIPFFTDAFTRGDIVEIDATKQIVRVLKQMGRTRHARYAYERTGKSFMAIYDRMAYYLHLHEIISEGSDPGDVALFVPEKISDAEFSEICRRAPVLIRPVEPGTN